MTVSFTSRSTSPDWTNPKKRGGNRKAVHSYLSCDGRPDFQGVVVGAADDAVATELEAGDHVVVMTFQHLLDGTDEERCSEKDMEDGWMWNDKATGKNWGGHWHVSGALYIKDEIRGKCHQVLQVYTAL